ncbi:MAG: TolC family protein, partial [Desulfovibrionaceae bacterium]|nr:TolC family protein [Desulfovibrionaceae bacterium]
MNKKLPLYPLLLSALLLSFGGCGPLPKQPASLPILTAEETARRYQLDSEWWHRYGSPSLDKTVSTALERNLDLTKAAILVNRSCYEANLIGANLVPTFAAENAISASKDLSGKSGTVHQYSTGLSLNYEVDLWKRLRHAKSAAQWETLATAADLESTRLALINNVVDAWFSLRYLEKAISIVERYVGRYRKLAELVTIKYDLGKIDSVEPLQAGQSLLAAQNRLLALQAEKRSEEARLKTLLNLRPDEPLPPQYGDIMAFSSLPVALDV